MILNRKFAKIIQEIFPTINKELDKALDTMAKTKSKAELHDQAIYLQSMAQVLLKIFESHKDEFANYDEDSGLFMKDLQQQAREAIKFLSAYPDAQIILKNFFKILGKKRFD